MSSRFFFCSHRFVFVALLVLLATFSAHNVKASAYGNFVGFLEDLEDEAGTDITNLGFPVGTNEMREAEGLVNCLTDAVGTYDVAMCVDDFSDTSLGEKMKTEGGVPSEVDLAIDCYILYSSGDYWGLAYKLAKLSACIVMRVLTEGSVDVCALLEELYDMAKEVYDLASTLINWLGDAAGAIVDAITGAACDMIGIGCDDKPSIPKEVILYQRLHPFISDGVTAKMKVSDQAYNNFLNKLAAETLAKANQEMKDICKSLGIDAGPFLYSQDKMDLAIKKFTSDVNIALTNDIMTNGVGNRNGLFTLHINNKNYLDKLWEDVFSRCDGTAPCSDMTPSFYITENCAHKFAYDSGFEFHYIDRWKSEYSDGNSQIQDAKNTVETNRQLCGSLLPQKKKEFIQRSADYIQDQNICGLNISPNRTGRFLCPSLDQYNQCVNIMGTYTDDTEKYCQISATELSKLAKEAKAKLSKWFRDQGSRFYTQHLRVKPQMESNQLSMSVDSSEIPLDFPCYRPTHNYYFEYRYKAFFGNIPDQLLTPVKTYDSAYKELMATVQSVVSQLNGESLGQDDGFLCKYEISAIDPLAVTTSDPLCVTLAEESGKAPGFDFYTQFGSGSAGGIDGLDKPAIAFNAGEMIERKLKEKLHSLKTKKTIDDVIQIDPRTELIDQNALRNNMARQDDKMALEKEMAVGQNVQQISGQMAQPGQAKVMSGTVDGQVLNSHAPLHPVKSAKVELMSVVKSGKMNVPLRLRLKNVTGQKVDFELESRYSDRGPYRSERQYRKRFIKTGNSLTLELLLQKAGNYRVRFFTPENKQWSEWNEFEVKGEEKKSARGQLMINPQPEPPGSPVNLRKSVKPMSNKKE